MCVFIHGENNCVITHKHNRVSYLQGLVRPLLFVAFINVPVTSSFIWSLVSHILLCSVVIAHVLMLMVSLVLVGAPILQLVMSSPFPSNPFPFSCQLSLRIYPPAESSCQEEQISLRVRSTLRDRFVVVTLSPATSHSHSASPFLLSYAQAPPLPTLRSLLNMCSQVACFVELSRRVRNG